MYENFLDCFKFLTENTDISAAWYYFNQADMDAINNGWRDEAVDRAFSWAGTPQGNDFWCNLSDRWTEEC